MFTQSLSKFLLVLVVFHLPCISLAELSNVESRVKDFQNLKKTFHRPVIIGASVSAGFITESPGERAARRYTTQENITNQARSGVAGKEFTFII